MKCATVILLVAAFVGAAVGSDPCADAVTDKTSGNYKNPESGEGIFGAWHCMTYYECSYDAKTDKATGTKKDCWAILPLRQYDPTSRECQWFWRANCKADNPSPSSPTQAPTTIKPTSPASTAKPTAAPTKSSR